MPELDSPPSLTALYPRALVGAVAELPRKLPGLGRGEPSLPDTELAVRDVEVDREHVAAYDRVCGFRVRDELPPTYPHMVAFPLAMKLMTSGSFPFPVIGLVHIANRIEQRRALRADERFDFTVHARDLREHERGLAFDLVADATAGGERVWHSTSTYLRRLGGGGSDRGKKPPEPPPPEAIWSVPGDIGRRYASVSGDINPIHMHQLSARLFGFPKPIAHGMWLKARCLAALEAELPDALAVEVSFKLPLLLPAKVAFSSWPAEGAGAGSRDYSVHDAASGKPHLSGSVRPA